MKNAFLVIAIFGSILLSAGETRAQCTCVEQYVNITARGEFNLAYTVFVGKVVAVKKHPPDSNNRYVETVTFQVTKAWKHDVSSNLTLTNTIQGCVNGFKENEEWLVYAYKNHDGSLGSYCCCSRTNFLAKAADDVKTFADDPPARILTPQYVPLLKGVDHFFATSSEPEVLLKFFRDVLGLPQVWAFNNFGDFASGGVWMGNVEFEVVTWKPPHGQKLPTEFKGIAFEPAGYTDNLVQELDRRAIKHGNPSRP